MKHVNLACFLFVCLALIPNVLIASDEDIDRAIAGQLANAPAEMLGFDSTEVGLEKEDQELYEIYHEFGLQAQWVTLQGPGRHAKALYDAIKAAKQHGLDPGDYHISSLQKYWESKKSADLANLDILLSLALVAWTNDTSAGRVHPRKEHPNLFARAGDRRKNPVEIASSFRDSEDPVAYLDGLHPQHRYYRGLKNALSLYRAMEEKGGWEPVPEGGQTLHPGERDTRVTQIRKRLAVTGEFSGQDLTSDLYDDELEKAVMQFQLFHGLAPDGITGAMTISEMNVPVEYRVRQIEMNMERWRWMNHDLENPYVLVDIAGFDVQGVVDDEVIVEMRSIVGKLHHETPIFSDHIKYIEFNPFWNLTPSIARHETIPKIRKDPDYLASKHIRVFDGWGRHAKELDPKTVDWNKVNNSAKFKFRQDPGPWNALGTMKFIFPNEHSVYLHDTPNHDLFEKAERSFSHGCIRLSEPAQLAEWVLSLNDADWGMAKIQEVLDSEQRTVKNLSKPLAVHLTYETVWIDGDSRLRFSPDIYGRDGLLEKTLYE